MSWLKNVEFVKILKLNFNKKIEQKKMAVDLSVDRVVRNIVLMIEIDY